MFVKENIFNLKYHPTHVYKEKISRTKGGGAGPPEPTPKSALEIIHEWNGYLDIFSRPQVKILDNICSSEQIFHRKLSLGAPHT